MYKQSSSYYNLDSFAQSSSGASPSSSSYYASNQSIGNLTSPPPRFQGLSIGGMYSNENDMEEEDLENYGIYYNVLSNHRDPNINNNNNNNNNNSNSNGNNNNNNNNNNASATTTATTTNNANNNNGSASINSNPVSSITSNIRNSSMVSEHSTHDTNVQNNTGTEVNNDNNNNNNNHNNNNGTSVNNGNDNNSNSNSNSNSRSDSVNANLITNTISTGRIGGVNSFASYGLMPFNPS
ncbi:unnamed protein product [[Candida] boidinii]|nr:unnamed protein product [[Candida] boidinii]